MSEWRYGGPGGSLDRNTKNEETVQEQLRPFVSMDTCTSTVASIVVVAQD
jgi:hypothetical protein